MDSATLFVNGRKREVSASPQRPLLWVLRDELQLTGTKYGCGEGQCGACTVLLEGKAVRSCVTPLSVAVGKNVTTIEGLAKGDALHPVQQAFLREEAFQCGYCTSGMIMSAVSLLSFKSNPSEKEIVDYMQGNICRCGTQPRIIAAIRKAATAMRGARS